MTPVQLEKRLDALERFVFPYTPPAVWVSFGSGAPAGWRFKNQTIWRELEESDEDFRTRVEAAAGPLLAPGESRTFIAIHEV